MSPATGSTKEKTLLKEALQPQKEREWLGEFFDGNQNGDIPYSSNQSGTFAPARLSPIPFCNQRSSSLARLAYCLNLCIAAQDRLSIRPGKGRRNLASPADDWSGWRFVAQVGPLEVQSVWVVNADACLAVHGFGR
jgi:hypothetical protein